VSALQTLSMGAVDAARRAADDLLDMYYAARVG
jgi:hypothetical protein